MNKDLTYSIYDLARFVDRSVQTIRYHIRINALPAQKIKGARATRVKAADAEKWAAKYFGKDISQPQPAN